MSTDGTNDVAEQVRQVASELAALREQATDIAHAMHEIRDALVQIQSDHEPK